MLSHSIKRPVFPILLFCTALVLAACQSGEERAEAHYQSALELMEAGDFERARVEFLNVFQNNGQHRDARASFAAMQRARGELRESYSQYLRLIEQFPDHLEGRIALAEMALLFQSWEEAERHGARAIEEAPDDPRVGIIAAYLAYLEAVEEGDEPARRDVFDEAMTLGAAEDPLLLRLRIDHALRAGELQPALDALEGALAGEPGNRTLNELRLSVLVELDQVDEVEAHLYDMLERFPEDEELPSVLLRFYLARGETEEAAAFLRAEATAEDADERRRRDALVSVVQLILDTEGQDAAIAELDRILAQEQGSPAIFGAMRASLRFDAGETEAAIAELESILADDIPRREAGEVRVALARMFLATGNAVGARAQVEQVLEEDPSQAEALKMLAAWLIDEDEADRAIAQLRIALDHNGDDPQALTLMAEAHTRNGNHELAQEFFSLAVEASGNAPAETLRYAGLLIEDERYLVAEQLLITALRQSPNRTELLSELGNLYIRMADWPRAEQVEVSLREAGDETSLRIASGLEIARLSAQGRTEDAVGVLEALAGQGGTADVRAQLALIRARLTSDDGEGAIALAQELVNQAPDEMAYRFALATTQSAVGDLAAAELSFRALTQDVPQAQQAWLGLIRILNEQGRRDEAETVLQEALTQLPDALDLLWAQASLLEQADDIDGAIAIYELMYERAPRAEVVANNLASLLSTYRDDEASLERAWSVARRLRGSEIAPFQDTYGWLAYRRGNFDDALEHLEPAAAGLPGDPLVQYHLGMAYAAVEAHEEAIAQLQRALELAGPEEDRPQFDTARAEITRLEALLAELAEQEASE